MPSPKTIIGIDPGQTGAVAALFIGTDNKVFAEMTDTPVEQITKGKKQVSEYLPSEMARLLSEYPNAHCYIEKVGAMPGNGGVSMFNFGKGFGLWIGILAALKIPYTLVTPQAWKKEIMQGVSDKDAARGKAMQLYPASSAELSRKKDIGRADALLIAEYGRRISK